MPWIDPTYLPVTPPMKAFKCTSCEATFQRQQLSYAEWAKRPIRDCPVCGSPSLEWEEEATLRVREDEEQRSPLTAEQEEALAAQRRQDAVDARVVTEAAQAAARGRARSRRGG